MTDELKPVKCGCGGEAEVTFETSSLYYTVHCKKCEIETYLYDSEAEAIHAWNRAMGAKDTNVGGKMAKVVTEEKPIEGSDNYIAVACCGECGNVVNLLFDRYCSGCGCRLEWK